MAETILIVSGWIVLVSVVISFVRFVLGPDYLNRLVAFDAMTIMTLSLIVLLAWFLDRMIYLDVALVYGLLSFLGVVAVARFGEGEL
ncbi:MAG: monovalent cation/H+ antiporter complex subunit F [Spirochaeta sp.]|nr:monovalent cation/H+ antiporter complex subunit F [Spirochaeta sp.]